MFWSVGIYTILPLLPQIFGTLGNNTRQFSSAIYYPIDMDKYYYPIYLHTIASSWLLFIGGQAANTIYCVFVEHACARFTMLG